MLEVAIFISPYGGHQVFLGLVLLLLSSGRLLGQLLLESLGGLFDQLRGRDLQLHPVVVYAVEILDQSQVFYFIVHVVPVELVVRVVVLV